MLQMILDTLARSGADAWEVTELAERGWEFYFIRHRLDQHRIKELKTWTVRVYCSLEEGTLLGSAGTELSPGMSAEEIRRVIDGLCQDAQYVRNPAYTLNPPREAEPGTGVAAEPDAAEISRAFLEAMKALPETETEDLNSYEIFVSEKRRRFLNSEGIDVTSVYPESMLEAVVNARKDGQEIELYRLYESGGCDREQVIRDLSETLRYGRDKLRTVATPAIGKTDVVFSTDAAREIYYWFIDRMSASMVYRGMSDWKIGEPVAEGMEGDRMTVRAVRELPNSSGNATYDREGAPIRDLTLTEAGVARHYFGNRQFSQYLGMEDSFIAENFTVEGGTATEEELRSGCFLEVVEFSDFQVDPLNGDIAGEIRLAYWHDGEQVIPVSGGSVSGTMRELVQSMRASGTCRQYNNMRIPAVTRLKGVTVTGAE